MKSILSFGEGYRTYVAAVLLVIVSGAKAQGYIDEGTYQVIMGVLGGLGLAALRASK